MGIASNWFLWALISVLCYGIHAFLFKKVVEDGGDLPTLQVINPAVVVVAAAIMSLYDGWRYNPEHWWLMILVASAQGTLFFLTSVGRAEALRLGTPAHVVFPLLKTSAPIVIVLSAYVFAEWESLMEIRRLSGVVLAVFATLMLVEWRKERIFLDRGVRLVALAVLASAGASLATKYVFLAGTDVNIFGFALISNLAGLLLATAWSTTRPRPISAESRKTAVVWGSAMGFLSFAGFSAFLQAIKFGDLSLVVAVNTLYVFIPIFLSAWLYGERVSMMTRVAVLLSIIATVLIR